MERTFQTYSPLIASIEVKRRGDVRRAKLYYLRERSGKSARIREKLETEKVRGTASKRVSGVKQKGGPGPPYLFAAVCHTTRERSDSNTCWM